MTIFISYASIYIQILNAHKVRRNLKDTFDHRPSHQIKHSGGLKKGKKPFVNGKSNIRFLTQNKTSKNNWTSFGICFAESLGGIKHFQDFEKADYRRWNERFKHPFSNAIKWKDCQMDPMGFCFAESLRGIKHFQDLKKADFKCGFWKCQHPF